MQYLKPSFSLPTSSGKISQTDWEIAFGLRNPDGSLKRKRANPAIKFKTCTIPPKGWRCTRRPGHEGPCAAVPE